MPVLRKLPVTRATPALVLAIVCLEVPAMSDQDDPRLTELFQALAAASSAAEATPVEREIWRVWFEAGDPETDRLMREGGDALDRGDGRAALAAFDAVVTARPNFAEGWNRRATVYFLMRRFPESVSDIARTLTLEPRHFGALSGLAMIREAQNDPFAALEALERVTRVYPSMRHLQQRIDVLSSMLGEAI
jgi:tetratricopeptide (TPR) repeat protein